MRLQEAVAAPGLAAGAAGHLMQQLERPLAGARIAVAETEVGIDDANQIEPREMMSLGDELRADDDVEPALRDVFQLLLQPLDRFHQIARQNEDAPVRKQIGRLVFEPFDAGTAGNEAFRRVAMRTFRWLRHRVAAMVADEPPLEAVIHQPRIAMRTVEAIAAGAA